MSDEAVEYALNELRKKLSPECIDFYTHNGHFDLDPSAGYEMNDQGVLVAFADGLTTVEKMLDYADVELKWYIPSESAIKFMMFIRLCLGEEPENSNPKAHYFFIDCVFQQPNVEPYFRIRNIDYDELYDRIAILATREFSKSTLMAYMFLFMASEGEIPGFGRVSYGIYIGDSMDNNVKTTMKTIKKVYQESVYLNDKFESTVLNADFVEFVRNPKNAKEHAQVEAHLATGQPLNTAPGRMKRTFSIKGIGARTGGKGSREGLARPDWNVFDDLIPSKEDASSEAVLRNVESTIESDILPGLNNNKNFAILIGTPYSKKDPVYRRIEERSWLPVVFPRGVEIIDGKAFPMSEETEEKRFRPVWEDRHSYRNCSRDFKKAILAKEGGNKNPMRDILQEHYLRISSSEDRLLEDHMLQTYSRADIEKNLHEYNIYITTDFTTTGSSGSDLSGIAVWAVNSNMDWFLLDISLRQLEIEEQYTTLFRMAKYYRAASGKNVTVGIETDGQQKAHIFAVKERMVKLTEFFTIGRQKGSKFSSEGILSRLEGGTKFWRFRMMLPMFQNHKMWFPRELKGNPDFEELMGELVGTNYEGTTSKYDDGLDLISMINAMEVNYPSPSTYDKADRTTKMDSAEDALWERMWKDKEEKVNAYDSYI